MYDICIIENKSNTHIKYLMGKSLLNHKIIINNNKIIFNFLKKVNKSK